MISHHQNQNSIFKDYIQRVENLSIDEAKENVGSELKICGSAFKRSRKVFENETSVATAMAFPFERFDKQLTPNFAFNRQHGQSQTPFLFAASTTCSNRLKTVSKTPKSKNENARSRVEKTPVQRSMIPQNSAVSQTHAAPQSLCVLQSDPESISLIKSSFIKTAVSPSDSAEAPFFNFQSTTNLPETTGSSTSSLTTTASQTTFFQFVQTSAPTFSFPQSTSASSNLFRSTAATTTTAPSNLFGSVSTAVTATHTSPIGSKANRNLFGANNQQAQKSPFSIQPSTGGGLLKAATFNFNTDASATPAQPANTQGGLFSSFTSPQKPGRAAIHTLESFFIIFISFFSKFLGVKLGLVVPLLLAAQIHLVTPRHSVHRQHSGRHPLLARPSHHRPIFLDRQVARVSPQPVTNRFSVRWVPVVNSHRSEVPATTKAIHSAFSVPRRKIKTAV
jgi:hypothetical protein